MGKPVGVIASAIVAILGSIFALLVAALSVASLSMESLSPQPPGTTPFIIANAVMFTALAGLGIWTAVGLFRLRSWARTSILIFAGFLAAFSLFSLLVAMAIPIPPEMAGPAEGSFRLVTVVMFGIPLAVAVWWLIQFNTPSTKAVFASPPTETASPRPLSITIIAWVIILGGAFSVLGILTRFPLFLFGAILTGWTAGVIYILLGALMLFIGKGLLELREQARILAIGWVGFSFVHGGIVTLVPSLRQRLIEMQRQLVPDQPDPILFDPTMLMHVSFAVGTIVATTAIWLLIRKRYAFS